MADPTSIAATQAAILKSAASKAATVDPALSTQAGAVKQDLAVMADQAKGYTAGVNAGVIVAQDNRAAQARRLATEKAQADAARARDAQMQAIQAQEARLRIEAEKANFGRQRQRIEAEQTAEPNEENARQVKMHMLSNTTPGFQTAFNAIMSEGVTSADEALAILKNLKEKDPTNTFDNVSEDAVQRYATAYFKALEGGAVNLRSLEPKRKAASSGPSGWGGAISGLR